MHKSLRVALLLAVSLSVLAPVAASGQGANGPDTTAADEATTDPGPAASAAAAAAAAPLSAIGTDP